MARKITAPESYFLANGKKGDQFYSTKQDRHLTAISTYYERSIRTERMIVINAGGKTPIAEYIVRVTIL